MNVLLNKDFLKELDNYHHREIYARITALNVNELPIEIIEGRVTGGNISIDGASAIRRTCSLSFIAEDVNINNFYWGLNNKFKLEIGLKNFINSNYPDIIWFSQGVFIITSFNASLSVNNFNISISGKDKMCLLNGDVGGSIPMSVDFGVEEVVENGVITYYKIPIKRIIKEMLHSYALEPYHNIIINDLEEKGLELLEYRGESPLYLAYDIKQGIYTQIYFFGNVKCKIANSDTSMQLDEIPEDKYKKGVDVLVDEDPSLLKVTFGQGLTEYYITKVEYGQTAGYRLTELTYAGDLISSIGESITSILDKIVNMLGNFEYFYDVDGRFIFQEKKTYLNTSWSPIIKTDGDIYIENLAYADQNAYNFSGNVLISTLSNAPNLNNIKNDYAVWGVRKGVTGAEIPIHFRYAVHKKPISYTSINITDKEAEELLNQFSHTERYKNMNKDKLVQSSITYTIKEYDWRELIYQMALDYFKYGTMDNFHLKVQQSNNYQEEYLNGITGYEEFYTDLQGFWRTMYNPNPSIKYIEYDYSQEIEETFIPIDQNKEIINNIFVDEDYIQLTEQNSQNVDKMKVMKLINVNGKYELHPLIDTIAINYEFDEKGKQKQEIKYYITDNSEVGYKEITENFHQRIEKKEIYTWSAKEESFIHILHDVDLKDNCFLKKQLPKGTYKKIVDLPDKIQQLFYSVDDTGKKVFNKYYLTTPLDLQGNVIKDSLQVYNYLTYYIESYDFFRVIDGHKDLLYWHKNVRDNPDLLNFWLDFLDTTDPLNITSSELSNYSISAIGNRPKVVNDNDVKSIYYRNVPNLIFTKNINQEFKEKSGYTFAQINSDIDLNQFNISAQGKSAKNVIDDLLYKHTYCSESINITAIPVYYLQPNTTINIQDNYSKINGTYIINRISLPLTYNGQMSIQATKIPQRFN